jgi:hypothetical protein
MIKQIENNPHDCIFIKRKNIVAVPNMRLGNIPLNRPFELHDYEGIFIRLPVSVEHEIEEIKLIRLHKNGQIENWADSVIVRPYFIKMYIDTSVSYTN